ncbi:MAG: hypothetical protein L0H19_02050 [Salinisphaera sp.]|nr:hypothetical protein [Salinisphaera sp.]MDN5939483.1 hypothetical protein [Salinisphaera sp.]
MTAAGYFVAFFAASGLFLLALGIARLRRRPLAAARSGLGGLGCLGIAALFIAVGLNLYTYQRLTLEQPVATLAFQQVGPQRFEARINPAGGPAQVYQLTGDQWQLDARVLKWTGLAVLLGLDARYRLDRLTGRYANADAAAHRVRTVHDLSQDRGLDLWTLAKRYPDWLPLVDASYGSATYLPMADGARFVVTLSQTGLVARPANAAARGTAHNW